MSLTLLEEFPQLENMIYFDSATKGLLPRSSVDKLNSYYMSNHYTVRKGLHTSARVIEKLYYNAKSHFGTFFGVDDDLLAWSPNADISLTQMIYSLMAAYVRPHFITTVFEHHSVLAPLLHLKTNDKIELTILGKEYEPCLNQYLEAEISKSENQTIVILGHTTQVLGLYRNLKAITQICRTAGAICVYDYSRTAGQSPIDLQLADIAIVDGSIDLLGPTGSGLIYVSRDKLQELDNPFPTSGNIGRVTVDGIDRLRGIEKFELGSPDIAGMSALQNSMEFLKQYDTVSLRKETTNYLLRRLAEIDKMSIIDPFQDSLCGSPSRASIVTLNLGFHSHDVALFLDEINKIQVRSGLLCSHPGVISVDLEETIQISTHIYNTKEDIDVLIDGLQQVLLLF